MRLLPLLLCTFPLVPQGCAPSGKILEIPRDDSFTVQSAAAKVLREYPEASAVVAAPTDTIVVHRDLVYASYGTRKLHLDIFRHRTITGSLPAILFIHGGGWSSGDRSMEEPLAQRLAGKGFVTATVEYRLSPEARFPAAVLDLKSAVRWLRARAAVYGIDTARIGVCGGSAGGHLAAFLGATNGDRTYDAGDDLEHSSEVQAVVDIDGPLDLTRREESAKDTDPQKPSAGRRWIGYSYAERPDLWREASPLFHAGAKNPPIAFMNSSLERFHVGRDEMIGILTPNGIPSEVHTIPGTPHPFWLFHPWFEQTAIHVERFFARVLRHSSALSHGVHHPLGPHPDERIVGQRENVELGGAAAVLPGLLRASERMIRKGEPIQVVRILEIGLGEMVNGLPVLPGCQRDDAIKLTGQTDLVDILLPLRPSAERCCLLCRRRKVVLGGERAPRVVVIDQPGVFPHFGGQV